MLQFLVAQNRKTKPFLCFKGKQFYSQIIRKERETVKRARISGGDAGYPQNGEGHCLPLQLVLQDSELQPHGIFYLDNKTFLPKGKRTLFKAQKEDKRVNVVILRALTPSINIQYNFIKQPRQINLTYSLTHSLTITKV